MINNDTGDEIVKEIHKRLRTFLNNHPTKGKDMPYKDFTKEVKSIVGNYGLDCKYEVFASGDNSFGPEWLYDLTWCSSDNFGFDSLELALESEQSTSLNQIKYDFDKLLVTNARIKIMICLTPSLKKGYSDIVAQCQSSLDNYNLLPESSRINLFIWDHYDTGKIILKKLIKASTSTS